MSLKATFLYSGMSDYWGGHGGRGIEGGAAFAHYGKDTTLKALVDQWVDDFSAGGDFDGCPELVTKEDIRACIIESLTGKGRGDYVIGAVCEFSADLEASGDFDKDYEWPVAIMWIAWDKCPDCNSLSGEDTNDGLCDKCHELHYRPWYISEPGQWDNLEGPADWYAIGHNDLGILAYANTQEMAGCIMGSMKSVGVKECKSWLKGVDNDA